MLCEKHNVGRYVDELLSINGCFVLARTLPRYLEEQSRAWESFRISLIRPSEKIRHCRIYSGSLSSYRLDDGTDRYKFLFKTPSGFSVTNILSFVHTSRMRVCNRAKNVQAVSFWDSGWVAESSYPSLRAVGNSGVEFYEGPQGGIACCVKTTDEEIQWGAQDPYILPDFSGNKLTRQSMLLGYSQFRPLNVVLSRVRDEVVIVTVNHCIYAGNKKGILNPVCRLQSPAEMEDLPSITDADLSPNGETLAVAWESPKEAKSCLCLYRTSDFQLTKCLDLPMSLVAFSEDGLTLAGLANFGGSKKPSDLYTIDMD